MARRGLAILATVGALAAALLPATVLARDVDTPPSPAELARQISGDEYAMADAEAALGALAKEPSTDVLVDLARHELQVEQAAYRYRAGVRAEQIVVYRLAVTPGLDSQVLPRLDPATAAPIRSAIEGLRALWRAAGIDNLAQVQIRWTRRFQDSAPVDTLVGYYQAAAGTYPVEWTYLASINFIESDFGRDNGPSSAGAMGPMQFMPGTWQDYGSGGDIMSPHDSIYAAARYLYRMGAPGNMDRAIYRYNNDSDYVQSVESFAAAFRADPTWVKRIYYWSTAG